MGHCNNEQKMPYGLGNCMRGIIRGDDENIF